MSKQQKALRRLLSRPKDFTWSELVALMESLGFELRVSAGSHRKFIHRETKETHFICEPHPSSVLKTYQVKETVRFLKAHGAIDESDT